MTNPKTDVSKALEALEATKLAATKAAQSKALAAHHASPEYKATAALRLEGSQRWEPPTGVWMPEQSVVDSALKLWARGLTKEEAGARDKLGAVLILCEAAFGTATCKTSEGNVKVIDVKPDGPKAKDVDTQVADILGCSVQTAKAYRSIGQTFGVTPKQWGNARIGGMMAATSALRTDVNAQAIGDARGSTLRSVVVEGASKKDVEAVKPLSETRNPPRRSNVAPEVKAAIAVVKASIKAGQIGAVLKGLTVADWSALEEAVQDRRDSIDAA